MPYNCFIQPTKSQAYAITSPEMLVAYDHDIVRTRPIAGTRPIKNDGRDSMRREELIHDDKENAEHLMLVDLGRNDLAKVSAPGTVKLNFYKEVKPYHKVYHMVSEVVGKRSFEKVFDPIRATFPAGTVSGAPKIRAMEIIQSLEDEPRKAYAGATYMIDESGRFTSCINIRCATFENGVAQIQVGSGIVYDSIVESERKELLNKIRGHLETMERMGNGHVFAH
jgi:anthranilate synthase component 1